MLERYSGDPQYAVLVCVGVWNHLGLSPRPPSTREETLAPEVPVFTRGETRVPRLS